jgi:hypothetical protein
MRFNRNDSLWCGYRPLKKAALGLMLITALASAQTPKSIPKKTAQPPRTNELTLAGLRPGRDTVTRAIALYNEPNSKSEKGESGVTWGATCQKQTLSLDLDSLKKIQVIRAIETEWALGDCKRTFLGSWSTGHGLRVGDPSPRVRQLYGEPDSKSPSSRGGQQLELWYYAFDWAGADVPQVMEVLCTKEKDRVPGRVIEITLAAPSL